MPPKISQSTKKYQADMAKAFRTADKDNDGFLTKKEYVQIFLDRGVAMIEEAAEAFFNEKDRDHDGKVSFEEFMGQTTLTEKIWNSMDCDEDGYVTQSDAAAVAKKYQRTIPKGVGQGLQQALNRRNKKRYTYDEFCGIMNELRLTHPKAFEYHGVHEEKRNNHRSSSPTEGQPKPQKGSRDRERRSSSRDKKGFHSRDRSEKTSGGGRASPPPARKQDSHPKKLSRVQSDSQVVIRSRRH